MEKDDFRHTLSFGDDLFGGPDWKEMVGPTLAAECRSAGTVPLLRDADGNPLKRSFVHLSDLTAALLAALNNPRTQRQDLQCRHDGTGRLWRCRCLSGPMPYRVAVDRHCQFLPLKLVRHQPRML